MKSNIEKKYNKTLKISRYFENVHTDVDGNGLH